MPVLLHLYILISLLEHDLLELYGNSYYNFAHIQSVSVLVLKHSWLAKYVPTCPKHVEKDAEVRVSQR